MTEPIITPLSALQAIEKQLIPGSYKQERQCLRDFIEAVRAESFGDYAMFSRCVSLTVRASELEEKVKRLEERKDK